jgi:hypothetical protein
MKNAHLEDLLETRMYCFNTACYFCIVSMRIRAPSKKYMHHTDIRQDIFKSIITFSTLSLSQCNFLIYYPFSSSQHVSASVGHPQVLVSMLKLSITQHTEHQHAKRRTGTTGPSVKTSREENGKNG